MENKTFVIEQKYNPFDSWKSYKSFSCINKAKISINSLNVYKHSLPTEGRYLKYRLIDKTNRKVLIK